MCPPRSSITDLSEVRKIQPAGVWTSGEDNEEVLILSDLPAWFCLQTQQKREHIAASQLRQSADIEVFLPRIRYRRPTRYGPAWVTEALFPCYLFARFRLASQLRRVQAVRGVRNVVHFGDRWPTIPNATIAELESMVGDGEIKVLSQDLNPGDTVEVASGVFYGFQALVARVIPRRQRVSVLLDFLGQQTSVELNSNHLIRSEEMPRVTIAERHGLSPEGKK
jgi:transcriptional antiterminator RfaH